MQFTLLVCHTSQKIVELIVGNNDIRSPKHLTDHGMVKTGFYIHVYKRDNQL